ncbi:hypothetical protein [Nocardia sp. NPDC051463]
MFDELARIDADSLELSPGHWPMFPGPEELADLILARTQRRATDVT